MMGQKWDSLLKLSIAPKYLNSKNLRLAVTLIVELRQTRSSRLPGGAVGLGKFQPWGLSLSDILLVLFLTIFDHNNENYQNYLSGIISTKYFI